MTPFATTDFTWRRPTQTHAFAIEVRPRSARPQRPFGQEPFLVQRSTQLQQYAPLREQPGLFLTFAGTDATAEGVLHFAQTYGRLGQGVELALPLNRDGQGGLVPQEIIEPLSDWLQHLEAVRHLYAVWEAARKADATALARLINKQYTLEEDPACAGQKRMTLRGNSALAPVLTAQQRIELAYRYLGQRLAVALRGLLQPGIVWEQSLSRPMPQLLPVSLLGAVYLQLAYAVAQDKHFQHCPHCGTWLEQGAGQKRADRQYCSASCRVLAYRARQRQARELASQGKTARQIADKLGCALATVRRWIRKGRK